MGWVNSVGIPVIHRILFKLHMFSFNIINSKFSPVQLKSALNNHSNTSSYNLRSISSRTINSVAINTKHGEWSFSCFYSNFLNKIPLNSLLFSINDYSFYKKTLLDNIDNILNDFIQKFHKFNFNVNFSYIYF